ncbi:hypothetical protein ANN_08974 [Periplaneta americana]|uniref:Paired domain-containing protein n=1 Tax=Periplaneta americana TaxID=6978 RepID=A0ABQ8T4D4_PERAM|nr:hypothetical protein ANN_08974 [Periplaneta americana]
MPQGRQLDPVLKGGIIGRLEAGQTQTEVSRALNVAQSVISRLWRRFEDTYTCTRSPMGHNAARGPIFDLNSTT